MQICLVRCFFCLYKPRQSTALFHLQQEPGGRGITDPSCGCIARYHDNELTAELGCRCKMVAGWLQGSAPAGQQMSREQGAGVSTGRGGARDTPQRPKRPHSQLPFHSSGRVNSTRSTDRVRAESRPKQTGDSAESRGASGSASGSRALERQPSSALQRQSSSAKIHGQNNGTDARAEQRPSSRLHSRQKLRPASANEPTPTP